MLLLDADTINHILIVIFTIHVDSSQYAHAHTQKDSAHRSLSYALNHVQQVI